MKKGDFLWLGGLLGIVALLLLPATRESILTGTREHPLLAGFIKFFILASMGELLALRIVTGHWRKPVGFIYRMIMWGVLGCFITIAFEVYSNGAASAVARGFLPVGDGWLAAVAGPFWVSLVMNATFGPILMVLHRFTDTFIDLAEGRWERFGAVSAGMIRNHIAWDELAAFSFKINLYLWLPAHTIVFLLPPIYRVLAAAFLSLLLGGILGYAKSRKTKTG